MTRAGVLADAAQEAREKLPELLDGVASLSSSELLITWNLAWPSPPIEN